MPNKRTHLWLSEKEQVRLIRLADAAGCSRSAVVRNLIMGCEIKPRAPAEWPELVRQISAIGNNINQLVRVANSERTVPPEVMREAMRLHAAVWEKVKNL